LQDPQAGRSGRFTHLSGDGRSLCVGDDGLDLGRDFENAASGFPVCRADDPRLHPHQWVHTDTPL